MKTICFTGMDGAGKSTQCRMLEERLRKVGLEVEVIHILTKGKTVSSNMQGWPLFRLLHKKLKSLPCYGFKGNIKLLIGLVSFFIDAWTTNIHYHLRYSDKIVIYDRFYYDQFVIFATAFPKTPWWIIRFLRFLPKSDMTIMLEVPPKIANMRKSENSVEKLTIFLKLYRFLASMLKVRIIDGTKDKMAVAEYIYNSCADLIDTGGELRY